MQTSGHLTFYVGTYTDEPSHSRGIAQIRLNPHTGELTRLEDFAPLRNPSYLTQSSQAVYSFSEVAQQEGAELVCIFDQQTHALPIAGDYPCHVATSPDAKYLAVANYGSGNVCVYALDQQGKPTHLVADLAANLAANEQDSTPERPITPHAHQVFFQSTEPRLVTVDLGCDAIRFYHHDEQGFSLQQDLPLPTGSGPRHLVFNRAEDTAYVVCELSETLVVITKTAEGWQVQHQADLLPQQAKGAAAGAIKLSADERFVYVSCRHQNAISCFAIQGSDVQWHSMQECGGRFPRDFSLSSCEQWLIVANQHSNNLVSFRRNPSDGRLQASGYQCHVDAPVCVLEQNSR
ncbi:6-phosphogluconolactonase [Vibrio cholerae]|nr:6-phosphogluconolactonase [Vibrio cholerae]